MPSAQVQADDTNCFCLPFRLSPSFKSVLKETCQLVGETKSEACQRNFTSLWRIFIFFHSRSHCLSSGTLAGGWQLNSVAGRLMHAQQWAEMHADPYRPRTHAVLCSHTNNLLTRHRDGIPLSPSVTTGHCRSDACSVRVGRGEQGIDTSPESQWKWFLWAWSGGKRFRSCFWILTDSRGELLASTAPRFPDSRVSLPTPLQPFSSAAFRGGLWVAMPWIYTWDLTIIHPRSFQIDSLLKVNCVG